MPDLLTHVAFAREVQDLMEPRQRELTRSRQKLYELGAQGPDIFFYYGHRPGLGHKKLSGLGGMLHNRETDRFLLEGFRQAGLLPPGQREDLEAYMLGFVCHYALDTRCHPFVYAFSGYRFNFPDRIPEYTRRHVVFEGILDVQVYRERTGQEASRVRCWDLFPEELPEVVDDFYTAVLRDLYRDRRYEPGDARKALKDLRLVLRFLYDPWGWKQGMLRKVRWLTGRTIFMGKEFYPLQVDVSTDYMNMLHRTWCHPLRPEDCSQDSFPDCWNKARQGAQRYFRGLEEAAGVLAEDLFEGYHYGTGIVWNHADNLRQAEGPGLIPVL